MRKAVTASLLTTFAFYVAVGLAGYAALGEGTPGNILTGFSHPAALVTAANAMVLVHMVSGARMRMRYECVAARVQLRVCSWLAVWYKLHIAACSGARRPLVRSHGDNQLHTHTHCQHTDPCVPSVQPACVPHGRSCID